MSEGGIELFNHDGELKEQAAVEPSVQPTGTVAIQLFHGHPDDGNLKEEAQIP